MRVEIQAAADVPEMLKIAEKTVYTMARRTETPSYEIRDQAGIRRWDIDAWSEYQVSDIQKDAGGPDE